MKLVGVNNASVSTVDDVYYIGVNAVEIGTKNSLAFYAEDGHTVSSLDTLKIVDNVLHIDSSEVTVSGKFKSSYIEISEKDYITPGQAVFSSLAVNKRAELNGIISLNGVVCVTGMSALFLSPITAMSKISLKNKININPRTIFSSKGSENDFLGDVAIDSKYIYYCVKDFDGSSNIWVRWKISDSAW